MTETDERSARSNAYLADISDKLKHVTPLEIAARIEELVMRHDSWREKCLNLNPAESLLSRRSRALLSSDMATRITEGLPGAKIYPHGRQNEYIDEIEAIVIDLAKRQFGAQYVEWRPVSTSLAMASVFFSLLEPGDSILCQSEDGGGNFSYHRNGPAGLARAAISDILFKGDAFEIDLDHLRDAVDLVKPKMIVIGGSNVLFPYEVKEIREFADRVGAIVLYDAAHLGLLISAGEFQRPLLEGAHVVVVSTHKIMGGPVGGMVLTNELTLAERIKRLTFPGLMQTRDQNKYAALALSLAETLEHGPEQAQRMVANAKTLAAALEREGFEILGRDRGYTQTHQIFLRLGNDAQKFEDRCQRANILLSDCALTGDSAHSRRTGARLATHEITRLGMGENEMVFISTLMASVMRDASEIPGVAQAIKMLTARHRSIRMSLDDQVVRRDPACNAAS